MKYSKEYLEQAPPYTENCVWCLSHDKWRCVVAESPHNNTMRYIYVCDAIDIQHGEHCGSIEEVEVSNESSYNKENDYE